MWQRTCLPWGKGLLSTSPGWNYPRRAT
jgi:hypothetical protein